MNTWEQQFANHGIHTVLEEIGQITDGAKISSDDPVVIGDYNRLLQVITHVRKTLGSANPNFRTHDITNEFRCLYPVSN